MEIGKKALDKVGHGDKFDVDKFQEAVKKIIPSDDESPDIKLDRRVAA